MTFHRPVKTLIGGGGGGGGGGKAATADKSTRVDYTEIKTYKLSVQGVIMPHHLYALQQLCWRGDLGEGRRMEMSLMTDTTANGFNMQPDDVAPETGHVPEQSPPGTYLTRLRLTEQHHEVAPQWTRYT